MRCAKPIGAGRCWSIPASITIRKCRTCFCVSSAGLRSGDRTMPEEINRLVTDAIADLLWTPSEDADANLRHEGVADDKIVRVGNIMIDSFEMLRQTIAACRHPEALGLKPGGFGV